MILDGPSTLYPFREPVGSPEPLPKLSVVAVGVADRPSREEAYMVLLSIIGELRAGTSPRLVMATRLIVPEKQLRAAGWNGELP